MQQGHKSTWRCIQLSMASRGFGSEILTVVSVKTAIFRDVMSRGFVSLDVAVTPDALESRCSQRVYKVHVVSNRNTILSVNSYSILFGIKLVSYGVKGKGRPITGHNRPRGGRVIALLFL
jgi:hypothetical protein